MTITVDLTEEDVDLEVLRKRTGAENQESVVREALRVYDALFEADEQGKPILLEPQRRPLLEGFLNKFRGYERRERIMLT